MYVCTVPPIVYCELSVLCITVIATAQPNAGQADRLGHGDRHLQSTFDQYFFYAVSRRVACYHSSELDKQ